MALRPTKAQRDGIKAKFGGKCAYCGCILGDKWHADHVQAVRRNDFFKKGADPEHPERDCIENLYPACPPCNIDKHSMSVNDWRHVIQRSNEVLLRDVATFRRAVRYGLVALNAEPIVFYFEKHEQ